MLSATDCRSKYKSCRRTLKFKFVSLQRTNLNSHINISLRHSDTKFLRVDELKKYTQAENKIPLRETVWNSKTHPVIRHSPYSEDYLNLRWNKLNFKVRAERVEEKSYLQTRRVLGRSSWLFEEHQWRSRLVAVAVKAVAVKIPFGCSSRFVESVKKPWIAKELSDSY